MPLDVRLSNNGFASCDQCGNAAGSKIANPMIILEVKGYQNYGQFIVTHSLCLQKAIAKLLKQHKEAV
jgi:hypothetical protein